MYVMKYKLDWFFLRFFTGIRIHKVALLIPLRNSDRV
jgi:hypothetical protein